MRATTRLLPVLGLLLAALPTASAAADPVPPHPAAPLAGAPTDVRDGQVVTLADGDRFEVTTAAQGRRVRGRRWDAVTGTWGPRTVIFEEPDRRCWGVAARAAGDGVAVRIGCGPALVEEWDGHPYAIVSADTQAWQSRRLPGYGWSSPGISPDGTRAVWARGDDLYTWTPAAGFVRDAATPPRDAAEGEAPMITDDGTVTVAYTGRGCAVTFDTYDPAGVPTRQVLSTGADCQATGVTGIDSRTLAFGDSADEWTNARLTRPDDTSPWTVGTVAPLSAPGLLPDPFLEDFAPMLLDAPERPLAVVGNGTDGLHVQLYDPALQSWQAPTTLFTRPGGSRCGYRVDATPFVGFFALSLRCAGADRVVTSTDGGTWSALPLRARAAGPNRQLGLVAVPDRHRTVVVSAAGTTTVPVGVDGRCDVVVATSPDRLLRLTSSRGRDGWPDLLQRSTARGWRTVHRVDVPTQGRCRGVFPSASARPTFGLQGRDGWMRVRFVEVDGHWDVRVRARPR